MTEEIKMLLNANKSSEFLSKNFKKFQKKYPNRVIAVKGNQIIKVAKDTNTLMKSLSQQELSSVLVASIPSKRTAFIL